MPHEVDPRTVLPYAPPRPRASRPALLTEVGCGSSLVGAILFGAALPWAAARNFEYDGTPSLVGGAVSLLFATVIGAVIGMLVVPAIVLSGYWIIWRIAGRP
jgi:hypothetical protein